ncbi:hypothetical protein MgSA37_00904 [Mucilaginibacter gotjawali]|uniref:Uncharacterized protein n=1 Tax=Mucilaginibacter gotjawali TaxID=1550579 RepID=A0A120MYA1_9SPHI|nr:hypothetical protein MgSA37_00904 [Mucilaginibacter gotjawali]
MEGKFVALVNRYSFEIALFAFSIRIMTAAAYAGAEACMFT